MKNNQGKMTLLFDRDRGLNIRVEDKNSGLVVIDATVESADISALLSRQAMIRCEYTTFENENSLGKYKILGTFTFEIPDNIKFSERKEYAIEYARDNCPEGWKPCLCFNSKTSFTHNDNKTFANCTIAKYVDEKPDNYIDYDE